VSFTDSSTGNPEAWSWNFGDGNTSADQNPSHTFQAAGRYRIRLTVSYPGRSATAYGEVLVLYPWTGRLSVYRAGSFVTQYTGYWCVGAAIQVMRNMTLRLQERARYRQNQYFSYARASTDYRLSGPGANVDGWAAALNRYGVGTTYRVIASGSFRGAIKRAALRMRLTHRPVGLAVAHGGHAWVMTAFTATADPAVTDNFTVTKVAVVGPLWPRRGSSYRYGYDMAPNTWLSLSRLDNYLNRYYDSVPNPWQGKFVTIQP